MPIPVPAQYRLDESPQDVFLEKTSLTATYLMVFCYALELVLFFSCLRILFKRERKTAMTRILFFYCALATATSTFLTAYIIYTTQLQWIDYRDYPGGPLGFMAEEHRFPIYKAYIIAYLCGNTAADFLLLWRCRLIWKLWLPRTVDLVIVLPATLLIIFSLVTAALWIHDEVHPPVVETSLTTIWPIAHLCSSLVLNICLTLLIVGRMYAHLRKVQKTLGSRHIRPYQVISKIFIESAALYCLTAIASLVTLLLHNPVYQLFGATNPYVQIIASYLIIYQLDQGTAWNSETSPPSRITSIAFPGHPTTVDTIPMTRMNRGSVDLPGGSKESMENKLGDGPREWDSL